MEKKLLFKFLILGIFFTGCAVENDVLDIGQNNSILKENDSIFYNDSNLENLTDLNENFNLTDETFIEDLEPLVEGQDYFENSISDFSPKFIFGFGEKDFLIATLNGEEIFNSNYPQKSQDFEILEGVEGLFVIDSFEEFEAGSYEVIGNNLGKIFLRNNLLLNYSDGDDGVSVSFEFFENSSKSNSTLFWSSNLNSGLVEFPIEFEK